MQVSDLTVVQLYSVVVAGCFTVVLFLFIMRHALVDGRPHKLAYAGGAALILLPLLIAWNVTG